MNKLITIMLDIQLTKNIHLFQENDTNDANNTLRVSKDIANGFRAETKKKTCKHSKELAYGNIHSAAPPVDAVT